jgi:plasmid stabilization system protein ParE
MSLDNPYKYRIIAPAKKELGEILKYYIDEGGIELADRFSIKYESMIEVLEIFPEGGAQIDEVPEVRSARILKFPYRIFYKTYPDKLEVVGISIYHSKRDLDKLIPVLKERIK